MGKYHKDMYTNISNFFRNQSTTNSHLQIQWRINSSRVFFLFIILFTWVFGFTQDTIKIHPNGNLRMHSGSKMGLWGTFINDGSSNGNQGKLYLLASSPLTLQGDSTMQFDSVILNSSNNVMVNQEFRITSSLEFIQGSFSTERMDSATAFIHFLDDATYSGQGDSTLIDGTVRKTGNDSFIFPIGHNFNLQPLAISSPGQVSDHFTVFYRQGDASTYGYSTVSIDSNCGGSPVLVDISETEYWNFERTGGSSDVEVTLSYNQNSNVNTQSELMVVSWDGSNWQSEGNGGVSGTATNGTIVTGTGCGSVGSSAVIGQFGPLSLGASTLTAVPVEFIYFTVSPFGDNQGLLEWATATELNNSHFIVERSSEGSSFKEIGLVQGSGNSYDTKRYTFLDKNPKIGINYYRIKQLDFDGKFDYTKIEPLYIKGITDKVIVYPNPAHDKLIVDFSAVDYFQNLLEIKVIDQYGRLLYQTEVGVSNNIHTVDITQWSSGIYYVQFNNNTIKVIKY